MIDRGRLRRIRNWQSHEWYAALVVRPIAILVMLVIADWRWVTPNRLTTLANVSKLLAAAAIFADEPRWIWPAAILLQLGLLFDHLDGTLARYRRSFTDFGGYYDKVSDAFTWFLILMAAGWVEARHAGGPLPIVLASIAAYALLTLGYMKWVAEESRARFAWFDAREDPAGAVARRTAPPPDHTPPERTPGEWVRWFLARLAQLPRFEEVDQFFWLGLALVLGKVSWFLWACAITQPIGVAIMFVRRGLTLARQDTARRAGRSA